MASFTRTNCEGDQSNFDPRGSVGSEDVAPDHTIEDAPITAPRLQCGQGTKPKQPRSFAAIQKVSPGPRFEKQIAENDYARTNAVTTTIGKL